MAFFSRITLITINKIVNVMKASKMNLRKPFLCSLLYVLLTGLLLTGCSSNDDGSSVITDDDNPANLSETVFKTSDFEIYEMTLSDISSSDNQIYYFYKVKNKTDKNYISNQENGEFDVYFRAKGSDGAWYDSRNSIDDLNAGASDGESLAVTSPEGITLDRSTFTYEVKVHE